MKFHPPIHPIPAVVSGQWSGDAAYKKMLLALIVAGAMCRIAAATYLELGNDEAYYWLYSLRLQWNYFDHPPLVALWIRFFTFNLKFPQEIWIRMGSIVGCALSTWFIYKATATAHSEKAGFFTACLFNASFYASITAGVYQLPDSPQIVFWTFCLWMISRIMNHDKNWLDWILLGCAAGLCIMSKVHGVFIWSGLILFILYKKKSWLKHPPFYIALLLSTLIISPIILWNIQNDFITYRFHSNRVSLFSLHWQFKTFSKELISQFLFNNPVNVAAIMAALFNKAVTRNTAAIAFQFIAWPLALLLILISLTRETLPHWSGPAYVTLLPLAGIFLAEKSIHQFPVLVKCSMGVFMLVAISGILLINFYPGTWGNKDEAQLGKGDITLDMYGWKKAGKEFTDFYLQQVKSRKIPPSTPLICTSWSGAHLEYYFGRPAGIIMIGVGPINDLHQYFWTNQWRFSLVSMDTSLCILPSDQVWPALSTYEKYYRQVALIDTIEITRSRLPAHRFHIYRMSGFKFNRKSVNAIFEFSGQL